MRPAERVTTIREIAAALSPGEWGDIDLVLKEFGFPTTESWNETSAEYVRTMVSGGSDDDLRELHGFLYSQAPCGVQKLDPAGKRAHSATSLASDELRLEGVRLGEK